MAVKFISNVERIAGQVKLNANIALRNIGTDIEKEARPHTPKDEGNLRSNVLIEVLGLRLRIRWGQRYAAAQEAGTTHGHPIVNYTTPGTGPHYARNAVKKLSPHMAEYIEKANGWS